MIRLNSLLKIVFSIAIISCLYSCVPRKQVVYFAKEDTTQLPFPKAYEPVIEPFDRIRVLVNSIDKEAASFFSFSANDNSATGPTFLVNINGFIDIPLAGRFHAGGLTTTQAQDSLKRIFEKYVNQPTVVVSLITFKVIMLGSINSPGIYSTDRDRLTILEAIALAGDLATIAKRENIMVIRQKGSGKEYGFIDITSKSVFTSPYYFLHSNDIIYFEPNDRSRFAGYQPYYALFSLILGLFTLAVVYLRKP